MAAAHGGDELAERRRPARVAPREVVEQGDPVGVGADGDDVADRLVDDGVGHRLGVVQAVPRVDADADGDAVGVAGVGEHDAVAGPVGARRRRAGARRCRRRSRGRSGGSSPPWRRCCGGPSSASSVAAGSSTRAAAGRAVGRRQLGDHLAPRPAVVEERRVEVEHDVAAVAHDEAAVAGERAEVGELDAVAVAAGLQRRPGASGGTATTIRSWASDSQISHGARPGYLSGAAVSSTSAPTRSAISPTADDSPPAPQSVIAVHRCVGAGRARRSAASR